MAKKPPVTIYHNPKCSTSRQVLEIIEASGASVTARQALRTKAPEAEELGLLDPKVSDAKLIDAMVAHPVLVERPFVVSSKGTLLARPKEKVREIL
jgi:arsenate reductase